MHILPPMTLVNEFQKEFWFGVLEDLSQDLCFWGEQPSGRWLLMLWWLWWWWWSFEVSSLIHGVAAACTLGKPFKGAWGNICSDFRDIFGPFWAFAQNSDFLPEFWAHWCAWLSWKEAIIVSSKVPMNVSSWFLWQLNEGFVSALFKFHSPLNQTMV